MFSKGVNMVRIYKKKKYDRFSFEFLDILKFLILINSILAHYN